MCLEEMYGGFIPQGAVFFLDRAPQADREPDGGTPAEVGRCAGQALAAFFGGKLPPPVDGPKCLKCSLREVCQPRLSRNARAFNARTARDACGEEPP
jgi:hypothetical protein